MIIDYYQIDRPKAQWHMERFAASALKTDKKEFYGLGTTEYCRREASALSKVATALQFRCEPQWLTKRAVDGIYSPSRVKDGYTVESLCALTAAFINEDNEGTLIHPVQLLCPSTTDAVRIAFLREIEKRATGMSNKNEPGQPVADDFDIRIQPLVRKQHLAWVIDKQKSLYHEDAVPMDLYLKWMAKNPTGFFIFTLGPDLPIGHLTLIPFKEPNFGPYMEGEAGERSLGTNDIWGPEDKSKMTLLYVESYIVDEPYKWMATRTIRRGFLDMANEVMNFTDETRLYAMDATIKGTNAIQRMGLRPYKGRKVPRLDNHTMYSTTFGELGKKLQDVSPLVTTRRRREALAYVAEFAASVYGHLSKDWHRAAFDKLFGELAQALERKGQEERDTLIHDIDGELKRLGVGLSLDLEKFDF